MSSDDSPAAKRQRKLSDEVPPRDDPPGPRSNESHPKEQKQNPRVTGRQIMQILNGSGDLLALVEWDSDAGAASAEDVVAPSLQGPNTSAGPSSTNAPSEGAFEVQLLREVKKMLGSFVGDRN